MALSTRVLNNVEALLTFLELPVIMTCRLQGPVLDEVTLRRAAELMKRRHPNLGATLVPDWMVTSGLRFEFQSAAQIQCRTVPRTSEHQWKHVMEEETNVPFSIGSRQLLWRLTLVASAEGHPDCELIFAYTHAIGDGTSATVFFRDLLAFYSQLSRGENPQVEMLPIVDPLKTVYPRGPPGFDSMMLSALMPLVRRQLWHIPRLSWATDATPSYTRLLFATGTEAKLNELHAKCKQQHLTVGTFLNTAAMWVVARQYLLKEPNRAVSEVVLSAAANLRTRMKPPRPAGDIAMLMCLYTMKANVNTKFWTAAKNAQASQESELGNIFVALCAFERLADRSEREVWANTPKGRTGDLALSNIGVYAFEKLPLGEAGPRISELYFANPCTRLGALHTVFINSVSKLNFVWSFDRNLVTEASAAQMLADLVELCENIPDENLSFSTWEKQKRG